MPKIDILKEELSFLFFLFTTNELNYYSITEIKELVHKHGEKTNSYDHFLQGDQFLNRVYTKPSVILPGV